MIKNKLKKITDNKKGFTIVESLFAIFILVISVTGPMAFTQSGLRASFIARDQVTAFYLAQDAIEYIKNVRDDNSIINIDNPGTGVWLDGLGACFWEEGDDDTEGCTIDTVYEDTSDGIISACGTSASSPGCFVGSNYNTLKQDDDGFFGFEGTDSIFVREIKIKPVPDDPNNTDLPNINEVEIDVVVKWETAQSVGEKSINVKENMFNWAIGGINNE